MTKTTASKFAADAKALLESDRRAAGETIDPGSAAANVDQWLTSAGLQPPAMPTPSGSES